MFLIMCTESLVQCSVAVLIMEPTVNVHPIVLLVIINVAAGSANGNQFLKPFLGCGINNTQLTIQPDTHYPCLHVCTVMKRISYCQLTLIYVNWKILLHDKSPFNHLFFAAMSYDEIRPFQRHLPRACILSYFPLIANLLNKYTITSVLIQSSHLVLNQSACLRISLAILSTIRSGI